MGRTKNNTYKYLLPCIYKYSPILTNAILQLSNTEFYYKDKFNPSITECLFIKVKFNGSNTPLINKIKESIHFVDSYLYSDVSTKEYILILSLPKDCIEAYHLFEEGKYSKMYSYDFLNELLEKKRISKSAYNVLAKTKEGKKKFIKILEDEFKVSLKKEWEKEYDFKPISQDILT